MYYFEIMTKDYNYKVKKLVYSLQNLTKFLSSLWETKLKIMHYEYLVSPYTISLLHVILFKQTDTYSVYFCFGPEYLFSNCYLQIQTIIYFLLHPMIKEKSN